jgi:DNA polymerase II
VVTPNGPEPLVDGTAPPRPDHAHYRDRQLAPAADGILHCLGTSFEALTSRQLDFFPAAGDTARTYR